MRALASFALITGIVVPAFAAPASPPRYGGDSSRRLRTLYTFGDSYTDSGHGAWIASNFTWPKDPSYYHHAFSNGPRWGEVVAKKLGVKYINPATGSATSNNALYRGLTGANDSIPVPSMLDQVNATLSRIGKISGEDSVAAIFIGVNSFFFAKPQQIKDLPQTVIADIERGIEMLREAGARRILLSNYPDLSLLPVAIAGGKNYSRQISHYGLALSKELEAIVAKPPKGVKFAFVDNKALFERIISNPRKYGFDPTKVHEPCLTGVYPIVEGNVPRKLCEDENSHVFFDLYHPTARAHRLIAREAEKAIGKLLTDGK